MGDQPALDNLTAVYELVEPIEEIGARPEDRIVVRPWAPRIALLQRTIPPRFAFDERSRLIFARPESVPWGLVRRHLEETLEEAHLRPQHLTLLH